MIAVPTDAELKAIVIRLWRAEQRAKLAAGDAHFVAWLAEEPPRPLRGRLWLHPRWLPPLRSTRRDRAHIAALSRRARRDVVRRAGEIFYEALYEATGRQRHKDGGRLVDEIAAKLLRCTGAEIEYLRRHP